MSIALRWPALLLLALNAYAQQPSREASVEPLTILTKDLPAASLWNPYGLENRYGFRMTSGGGLGPHRWRIVAGALPQGLKLEEFGDLLGTPQQSGQFEFTVLLSDNSHQVEKKFALNVETPLRVAWDRKAQVSGPRIDGSVKVSNTTGRDLDLTFVVLAVNDIGRATAIGYQHFPLKSNTRDMELPFGDSLSPGNYAVHVDVVGEEPVSDMIFRARLVAQNQPVTQGP